MPFTGVLMQPHKQLLIAVFNVYKAKNSSKYFWMEHWISFLEGLQLLGDKSGLGTAQAKLIFIWSQVSLTSSLPIL